MGVSEGRTPTHGCGVLAAYIGICSYYRRISRVTAIALRPLQFKPLKHVQHMNMNNNDSCDCMDSDHIIIITIITIIITWCETPDASRTRCVWLQRLYRCASIARSSGDRSRPKARGRYAGQPKRNSKRPLPPPPTQTRKALDLTFSHPNRQRHCAVLRRAAGSRCLRRCRALGPGTNKRFTASNAAGGSDSSTHTLPRCTRARGRRVARVRAPRPRRANSA